MSPESESDEDVEEAEPDEEESGRELEFEHYLAREEVIDHFESFLDGFDDGDTVTMSFGDETLEFDAPPHMQFEVEYEEHGDERELEFELEWRVQDEDFEIGSSE
ncbi:amphi-Trp domain-containing protein [Natronorubrum thiooxidans]|uniref:Amphi-Trp domain-containing protein n=1 Tax=Natronorubrum thiooxidans TaxID=308853 RepID=A0A1N7E397_9EURY|nr:amphi-Trp domain-containing protein [Natronorubrum thiooxidans]SIR82511.1 amphi-Trp domain-containing protein [Natronorubrum thiooxidans]